MKVLGIVAEYNPFHNGHLYQIECSVKGSSADAVVCVMSGDFVQRGEPALFSKWSRAKAAAVCGIDLVFELPVIYSTASAEAFARGAVSILDSLGSVDILSFGSESGNLDELSKAADLLLNDSKGFDTFLKAGLLKGLSYPSARQYAVDNTAPEISRCFAGSNNVLAIEYLKALKQRNSSIEPLTIHRIGSDYKAKDIQGRFSSATSIRQHIISNGDIRDYTPQMAYDILKDCETVQTDDFTDIIFYLLRSHDITSLLEIDYMNDGVAQILKNNSLVTNNISELIQRSNNKRHTDTRFMRALAAMLLGITNIKRQYILDGKVKPYTRVLAFNDKGAQILSKLRDNGSVSIITKAANHYRVLDKEQEEYFLLDLKASDIYSTIKRKDFYPDITVSPIRLHWSRAVSWVYA
jgi:predicted nucleotidyltransferase